MNPGLLLSLWRERWGKPAAAALRVSYVRGRVTQWAGRLAKASVWSLPGFPIGVPLVLGVLLVLLLPVQFSENGQIAFSAFLLGVVLYLRRHAGGLTTLALLGLSILVSARYLYWRFSATLGPELNTAFLLGFALCVAELHLCLLMALSWIQNLWPLKRAPDVLPSDPAEWPTVDVLIPCAGQPLREITPIAEAAVSLDWPREKIRTVLIDDLHRDEVKALADALGATYLTQPVPSPDNPGKFSSINAALSQTRGELIAILDGPQPPDKAMLRVTAGWFVRDPHLGLLQTPHHFLAPAVGSSTLTWLGSDARDFSLALIRRSALVAAGGLPTTPGTEPSQWVRTLRTTGHGSACLGWVRSGLDGADGRAPLDGFRVDHPCHERVLLFRRWLFSIHEVLRFYGPVSRCVFLLAPLPYLLAGINIIQATPGLWAALAVPHWLHAHVARTRVQGPNRFTIWVELREAVLACYLLLPTAAMLVKSEFDRLRGFLQTGKTQKLPAFDAWLSFPLGIALVLNLVGFGAGLWHMLRISGHELHVAQLYMLWCAGNLLLLSAMAAVAEEARQIRHCLRQQLRLPVMLELPLGRTLSCVSENFPELPLAITLPAPAPVVVGAKIRFSIFHRDHEFSFPAHVVSLAPDRMFIRLADVAQADYLALGQAAHSRGPDWRQWLPGRDADRLLPPWLTRALIAILDFGTHFGQYLRLQHWLHLWKKNT